MYVRFLLTQQSGKKTRKMYKLFIGSSLPFGKKKAAVQPTAFDNFNHLSKVVQSMLAFSGLSL